MADQIFGMEAAEVMAEMSKAALEVSTTQIARHARELAKVVGNSMTGQEALELLARTIEETNAKQFPKGTLSS